jgi:hypothetical protein
MAPSVVVWHAEGLSKSALSTESAFELCRFGFELGSNFHEFVGNYECPIGAVLICKPAEIGHMLPQGRYVGLDGLDGLFHAMLHLPPRQPAAKSGRGKERGRGEIELQVRLGLARRWVQNRHERRARCRLAENI